MKPTRKHRSSVSAIPELSSLLVRFFSILVLLGGTTSHAQELSSGSVLEDAAKVGQEEAAQPLIRFSFDRTPWREVIRMIADEAGLALHVSELPTGSFSYSDPNAFTHEEAIDRINLFLLPEGYTLVRNGNLLSVINLADPRSKQQLDALADLVGVADLVDRPDHDVVKCLFVLDEIDAEEAVGELSVLKLMTTPEVLEKTNQLLITDTVARLRSVQKILDAFRSDQLNNGTVVKSFGLKHVDAEDVLVVARPHLGLAPDEMIGIDVSVSADVQGKQLFVTGVEDKVKLLEGLVQAIDQPKATLTGSGGAAELRNHLVEGGNVETVYNVLQTLLAGKEVRLSMDEASSSLVALASPEVQREIEQTVQQLQAQDADFEVIPLTTADPYQVVSLLEQMLDLPGPLDDPDEVDPNAPRIDADPANRRLFVRAKRLQIEQIKKIVDGLDKPSSAGNKSQLRIFPLGGSQAEDVLESAVRFWRDDNPVVLYRSLNRFEPESTERVLTDDATPSVPSKTVSADNRPKQWLTTNVQNASPAIRLQLTPQGVLMQSDDGSALDRFEDHLRTIAGPFQTIPSPPIVFYLKYTKAEDAIRMLSELLEGGEVAEGVADSSLVNGYVTSSNNFFGGFITSQEGMLTLSAGNVTVVADPRLNRLIVQGNTDEVEEIEGYLRIIDKDNSLTSVETHGTSKVIELVNTRASEVAEAIRQAFAGRVIVSATNQPGQGGSAGQGGQPGQGGEKPQPQVREETRGGGDGDRQEGRKAEGGSRQPVRDLEPKMTVAVHEQSNSLIVTAPQQLYEEVERLALSIDQRALETVEIVTPVNAEVFETVLQQFLGQASTPRRPSFSGESSSRSDRSSYSSSRGRDER